MLHKIKCTNPFKINNPINNFFKHFYTVKSYQSLIAFAFFSQMKPTLVCAQKVCAQIGK